MIMDIRQPVGSGQPLTFKYEPYDEKVRGVTSVGAAPKNSLRSKNFRGGTDDRTPTIFECPRLLRQVRAVR
jgi:hypothetical protein